MEAPLHVLWLIFIPLIPPMNGPPKSNASLHALAFVLPSTGCLPRVKRTNLVKVGTYYLSPPEGLEMSDESMQGLLLLTY